MRSRCQVRKRGGAWWRGYLATIALALCGLGCASEEKGERRLVEAFVRKDGRRSQLVVQSASGREISSVYFDPKTGVEDYSTQRFFGFDVDALTDMAERGREDQIPPECMEAAHLWQGDFKQLLEKGKARRVLKRQSQIMALCLDLLGGEHSDGCSGVPDFNFRGCCVTHDACYQKGGSEGDRLRCDFALRDCIAAAGHPILARVYFAGVRAFGGSSFRRR